MNINDKNKHIEIQSLISDENVLTLKNVCKENNPPSFVQIRFQDAASWAKHAHGQSYTWVFIHLGEV